MLSGIGALLLTLSLPRIIPIAALYLCLLDTELNKISFGNLGNLNFGDSPYLKTLQSGRVLVVNPLADSYLHTTSVKLWFITNMKYEGNECYAPKVCLKI